MARPRRERPIPWAEERRGLTRFVWRFEDRKYRTPFYEDPEEAHADALNQITEQIDGTWTDRSGPKTLVEDWIDEWRELLPADLAKKTQIKYQYFIEFFILPQFQGRELGSLSFGEIERWEKAIPKRISARGTPYAPSVASGARSLLITILGDAVHAKKIGSNPAVRRKGRRGQVRAKGRRGPSYAAKQAPKNNVLTPFHAICLAERCALMSGRDIDFVMNVFAAWSGPRWGELMAVEGSEDEDSPLQLPDSGNGTYALDWQLLEIGGEVSKAPPRTGHTGFSTYRPSSSPCCGGPSRTGFVHAHARGSMTAARRARVTTLTVRASTIPRRRTTCSSAPGAGTPAGRTTPTTS